MFRSAVLFAAVLAAFAAAAVETVLVCEDERMLPFLKSAAELRPEGIDFAPLAGRPLVPAVAAATASHVLGLTCIPGTPSRNVRRKARTQASHDRFLRAPAGV